MPLFADDVIADSVSDEAGYVYRFDGAEMMCPVSVVEHEGRHITLQMPWVRALPRGSKIGTNKYLLHFEEHEQRRPEMPVYDSAASGMLSGAAEAAAFVRDPRNHEEVWRTVVLILCQRFFRDTRRFMFNGRGVDVAVQTESRKSTGGVTPISVVGRKRLRHGLHFMVGPRLPTLGSLDGGGARNLGAGKKSMPDYDLLILRPNIEHEMLAVIMGRGGTQELGCTFWGQSELSCYDDAQHGIWGMSYKYHERAIVLNERNLIRTFDVAFDGYNGGMDQTFVDWTDNSSLQKFRDDTYARDRPYNGPSMLVMKLPANKTRVRKTWPNPIVFHTGVGGNLSLIRRRTSCCPTSEHMIFDPNRCTKYCAGTAGQVRRVHAPTGHAAVGEHRSEQPPRWRGLHLERKLQQHACVPGHHERVRQDIGCGFPAAAGVGAPRQ